MGLRSILLGRSAERRAARYLSRLGLDVIERNVHIGGGEIDLICVGFGSVVFCEVKQRRHGLDAAFEAVDATKRRRLTRAVRAYRSREKLWDVPARGDVIAITREGGRWRIAHQRGAFEVA